MSSIHSPDGVLTITFVGAYTPVTMNDNIMVDGVLASCYAFFDHDLAHITMTPIRWFPVMTQWIFGEDNGNPLFARAAEDINRWILPSRQLKSNYF